MWVRTLLALGLALGICLTSARAEDNDPDASVKPDSSAIDDQDTIDDSKEVEILDLGIVEGYRYQRHHGHQHVEVLDIPFGAVLKAKRNEDGETGYRFLHVPFVTVAERDLDDDSNSFRLLDVPFFSLVKTRNDDDGDFDRQVIDLPLLGPLFRHKRVGDKQTTRFLFLKHSWTANDAETEEPRPAPRRSNAHPG